MKSRLLVMVAVLLAGAMAAPTMVLAQADPAAPAAAPVPEKIAIERPPDLAFARIIALIRGHLLIADELLKQGERQAAYAHFNHPREELYGVIRADLKNYRTPQFDGALKNLARAAKARKPAPYAKAWQAVEQALAAADVGLKEKQGDWPRFMLAAALEVLKTAPDEYFEAVVRGRIAKAVEYQDARGFILQAEKMIESVAAGLEQKDAAALQDIRAGVAELKQVFPTAIPPSAPIKDQAAVLAIIARIEAAAGRLL